MSKAVTERNIIYACSVHARQLRYGDKNYSGIEQTIQINLLGYRTKQEKVKERYSLRNEEGETLSDRLIIDIIDMEKGRDMWYTEPRNKMNSWCKLFLSNNESELEESRKYIMGREAGEKLDKEVKKLSEEDEMVYLYTELSREELERNTYIEEAKEQGLEQGISQGIQQAKKEMIQEMIKLDMSKEQISKITKLSIEQIEEII